MGPVRRYKEHKAEFRARQARYSLKWFVVMLTVTVVLVPVVYIGWCPIPVTIVITIALLFGLGISGLATLSALLARWQAQRTPSAREQRVLDVIGVILGAMMLLGVQLVLWLDLWIALQTGEITSHHRHRPSTTYALQTEPVGFLLFFGFEAAISLVIPVVLLCLWRRKRRAVMSISRLPGR